MLIDNKDKRESQLMKKREHPPFDRSRFFIV